MIYDLPTSVDIGGKEYEIRSDYRAVLDICTALTDVNLSPQDKAIVVLDIFYPGFAEMPPEHYEEAIRKCFWFINCGDEIEGQNRKAPKLMDWEQDWKYIVASINRIIGQEIRSIPYMHWWTFISAYYEIGGDCLFAQIVRIREKLLKGKKLDKAEREWYNKNRHLVDFKTTYSEAEKELLKQLGIK